MFAIPNTQKRKGMQLLIEIWMKWIHLRKGERKKGGE
jgi:hypothetical protein